VNYAAARILGYESPADMQAHVTDFAGQVFGSIERLRELRARLISEGSVGGFECEARRKDGTPIWLSLDACAVRTPAGEISHLEGFAKDITAVKVNALALQRAREDAERGQRRLQAVLDAAPTFLLIVRLDDGAILACTARSERLFGCPSSELVGKSVHHLYYAEAVDRDRFMSALLGEGRVGGLEIEFQRVDGSRFWGRIAAERLRFDGQESVIAAIEDIDALRTERDRLVRANAAKSTFLARASHDVRTRLNAIVGYSELVRDELPEPDTERRAADLRLIHAAGLDIVETLDTMIALGRMQVDAEPEGAVAGVAVSDLIADVIALVRPVIEHHGNRLIVTSRVDGQPWEADETRLKHVLFNLLVNAGRRTRDGTVRLSVETAGDALVFAVADTGSGMQPGQLEALFRPFTDADAASTTDLADGHLGLALSRRLCRLMGGDLSARSAPGQGSCFEVRLPARPAPRSPAGATEATEVSDA